LVGKGTRAEFTTHTPMKPRALIPVVAVLFAAFCPLQAFAITTSSLDTFAASNEGWQIGGAGAQPAHVASAGPDSQIGYLSHFSDGSSANGKWLMWNDQSKWLGNYTSAGVTGINLWANVNAGTAPVSMRIAFDGPGGWFYSAAQNVGTGWSEYSFLLAATNFTYATSSGGTTNFSSTMSGVTRFEILAGGGSVTYRSGGDLLQAGTSVNTILVDNIGAVPEPSTYALLAMTSAGALWWAWRRR
jgi:hypothetical protein